MSHILPTLVLAGTALLGVSGAAAQSSPAGQSPGSAGQSQSQYPSAQGSGGQSQGAAQQGHSGAGAGAAGQSGSRSAGGASPDARMSGKAGGSAVTVTGCLAKGDEANEYSIKDANGKAYGLKAGSGVNLKPHVGHQVSVTGTAMSGSAEGHEGAKESGAANRNSAKAGGEESEHLMVSDLKMISTSCQ